MIFPIEVWEVIFGHSEAKDLLRFKSVCILWNKIIPRILETNDRWYKQCIQDIPKTDLNMILDKVLAYSDGENLKPYICDYKIWRGVYNSWMKWQKLNTVTWCSVEKIYGVTTYELETITCISTSGSLIVVGTNDGFVRFYNMYDRTKTPIFVADHGTSLCDVKILEYENYIIGVSLSLNSRVKFWDVLQKKKFWEHHADIISVSHGYCYLLKGNLLTRKGLESSSSYVFDNHDPQFKAIIAEKNEVFLWSVNGENVSLKFDNGLRNFVTQDLKPPPQKIGRYKIFGGGLATYISYDGILSLSFNNKEWVSYDIFSFLNAKPTSVYYYNKTLFIGLDTGEIYLYHVNSSSKLMCMDFSPKKASLTVEVCESSISSLDILEHKQQPFIVATCEKYIYIVDMKCQ